MLTRQPLPGPDDPQGVDPRVLEALRAGQTRETYKKQIRSGGSWFFWIAGLSLVNTVLWMMGSTTTFIMGLGITQFVSGFAMGILEDPGTGANEATLIKGIALAVNLAISVVFGVFGVFSRRGAKWAFLVGMVLYGLDALLFVWVQEWLSLAFHGIALWGLFSGLRAAGNLEKFERAQHGAAGNQPAVIQPIGGLKL